MDIGIKVEWCRNPIKLELGRHAIPLLGFCSFLACLIGYHWAWKAFENEILHRKTERPHDRASSGMAPFRIIAAQNSKGGKKTSRTVFLPYQ